MKEDIDKEMVKRWIEKEWFTVLAILLIIMVVAWHQSSISSIVNENIDRCNAHYEELIAKSCPQITMDAEIGWMDLEENELPTIPKPTT